MCAVGSAKDRLVRTFFELLEQKHYSKITVSELIEKAEVSRTTFYRHFVDIFDMYDKVCKLFIEEFVDSMFNESLKCMPNYKQEFFEHLLEILNSQEKYVFLLCGENGDKRFFKRGFDYIEKKLRFLSRAMKAQDLFKIKFIVYAGIISYIESVNKKEELPFEIVSISRKILNL